ALNTGDPGQTGANEATVVSRVLVARCEEQEIAASGTVSGGTFTLTFAAQTTAAIPFDATALQIRHALENLSNVDPGDVIVTGGPLPTTPIVVRFEGQYEQADVAAMTADSTNLTGGGSYTVTVTQEGVSGWSAFADDATTGARQTTNASELSFGNASGAEALTHFSLWDAAVGGNFILGAALTASQTTVAGQPVTVPAGNIVIVAAGHGQTGP
ncbi:MAG TPA: hypothetical protein VF223_12625, partial [Trebonia sp.]